jgi:hypothetical protein
VSDYWTPYQPKVGDRVRVRVSPECPAAVDMAGDLGAGTILSFDPDPSTPGHHWIVQMDDNSWPGTLAATEMVPFKEAHP